MEQGWRWSAAEYARNSSAQKQWARELIGMLRLRGDESVLDVGCGDGTIPAEIAGLLPRGRVTGIDSSEDMVAMALATFPALAHSNLTFRMADARSLPFDSEFDIVISNATLHWVKDHRPVLRGIARSLVPGGMALLSMGGRGNGADFFAVANDMTRSAEWQGYFAGFEFPWGFHDAEEYGPWCEAAGLRPRRIELIPRDMLQDGIEGLEGWVRTTWMPYTHRVPEDRRPRFIRQAVDRYVALHPLDADGRARVRMVRLEVEAVRASS